MKTFETQLAALLENVTTWQELKNKLSLEADSGKLFEAFCKHYFLSSPLFQGDYNHVWYFQEIPFSVKTHLGFLNMDYGVDVLLEDKRGQYTAIQCKFRSNEKSKLNWSSDKIAHLFAYGTKAHHCMIFSNVMGVDQVSSMQENFSWMGYADLMAIEESTFQQIRKSLLGEELLPRIYCNPLPHQTSAVKACLNAYQTGKERGQLIMPCGSGKTLVGLWLKEALKASCTLVLVPSLYLLRQIKETWALERKHFYEYLCVCSEADMQEGNDQDRPSTQIYEIGTQVTTRIQAIEDFLKRAGEKVIFSTYQSLHNIAEAIKFLDGTFSFDFVFCDEAHRTAGIAHKGFFTQIHHQENIPAKKRLYATATPRILSEKSSKKLDRETYYVYDMSDAEIFGEEFYRMSFKDAIKQDILCDYEIIAIGVNDEKIAQYIKERRYISQEETIEDIAHHFALDLVMNEYQTGHAITFHSKVSYAASFCQRHQQLFPEINSFFVSGNQSTHARSLILKDFAQSKKGIVSNARCLTEGIDVPSIDLIYFCDPKNSKIDIVQAIGRVLRKSKNKQKGYIVVPIYHTQTNSLNDALEKSSYKNFLTVVRAICEQDERLQEEINDVQLMKGQRKKKETSSQSKEVFIQQRIHLLGFEENLQENLFSQMVEFASNEWEVTYLELKNYLATHASYPSSKENAYLYYWCSLQRHFRRKNTLSAHKIGLLNKIGFVWNLNTDKWDTYWNQLHLYSQEHRCPPSSKTELGLWYKNQLVQLKKNLLSAERSERLNSIQFVGTSLERNWETLFKLLQEFREKYPLQWPLYDRKTKSKGHNSLSLFCVSLRKLYKEKKVPDYWIEKLNGIQFNWNGQEDIWLQKIDSLKEVLASGKNFRKDKVVYNWLTGQYNMMKNGKLSPQQKEILESLALDINKKNKKPWQEWYGLVKDFWEKDHQLPTIKTQPSLAGWLLTQKMNRKKGLLSKSQIELLDQLGIVWDSRKVLNEHWSVRFKDLKAFMEKYGRYPRDSKPEEKVLYNWCQTQRQKRLGNYNGEKAKNLSTWQIELLDSIGFDFNPKGKDKINRRWMNRFCDLRYLLKSHSLEEIEKKEGKVEKILQSWLKRQRTAYKKGRLENREKTMLENLNVL